MIGTEQERDAIMAAIVRFGEDYCTCPGCRANVVEPQLAAIRAMLAPDDAVVIPRALAERVFTWSDMDKVMKAAQEFAQKHGDVPWQWMNDELSKVLIEIQKATRDD